MEDKERSIVPVRQIKTFSRKLSGECNERPRTCSNYFAQLDPLRFLGPDFNNARLPELELSRYAFTERVIDKEITLGSRVLTLLCD